MTGPQPLAWAAQFELCCRRYRYFVQLAWQIAEPGAPLKWNWHHDVICDELERAARREVQRLVICIPPRSMKSYLVSVFWLAWIWLWCPTEQAMFISKSDSVAGRDSWRMRRLIQTPWYQALRAYACQRFGVKPWGPDGSNFSKINFHNSASGFRICFPLWGSIVGEGANIQVLDDPYDVKEVIHGSPSRIAERMEEGARIWDKVLPTRLNDRRTAVRVIIMQRLHPEDVAGKKLREGWPSIVLPMRYDPEFPPSLGGGNSADPRTEPGELLHPERVNEQEAAELEQDLGEQATGQLGQRPVLGEGVKFRASYFTQRYDLPPLQIAPTMEEVVISVDAAEKDGHRNDWSVLVVWGRMELPELEDTFLHLVAMFPTAALKLIEDKSNGTALIQRIRSSVPGVVGFNPGKFGGKATRAGFTQVAARAGELWLPRKEHAPWVVEWVAEHIAFPLGSHDDQVDATSQAFVHFNGSAIGEADLREQALGWLRDLVSPERPPAPEPVTQGRNFYRGG